jgi:hypothetical protein
VAIAKILSEAPIEVLKFNTEMAPQQIYQLLSGENLDKVSERYISFSKEGIENFLKEGDGNETLYNLTKKTQYYASTKTLFGKEFESEKTFKNFFEFDDNIAKVFILPSFMVKKEKEARRKVIDYINKFDYKDSCELFKLRIKLMKENNCNNLFLKR